MLGAGTQSNPYLVSTSQDLHDIRLRYSSYYKLTNDIDMSHWGNFIPIGKASPFFKGHINGNGYKIKNLTINDSSNQSGFIGYLHSGSIKNLGIENANVESTGNNVGILVGYLHKSTGLGIIESCYTTGSVSGSYNVGGLVGYTYSGSIDNCYSQTSLTGLSYVGGLVGRSIANVPINESYSTGNINNSVPSDNVGGLIGFHQTPTYVTDSFYDIETSGQTNSSGGEGKTTQQKVKEACKDIHILIEDSQAHIADMQKNINSMRDGVKSMQENIKVYQRLNEEYWRVCNETLAYLDEKEGDK